MKPNRYMYTKNNCLIQEKVFYKIKSAAPILSISRSLWLIALLVLIPTLGFGAQKPQSDSLSVLSIIQYKTKHNQEGKHDIRKINYLAAGAQVNLTLIDGRTLRQVQIHKVEKDHLVISGGERVPLDQIQEITVGKSIKRALSKIFGSIVLAIGIWGTLMVIWVALGFAAAFWAVLLLWIPGYLWVEALFSKFPKLSRIRSKLSLKTVSLSSLSEKARAKLSRPSRFYRKKVK